MLLRSLRLSALLLLFALTLPAPARDSGSPWIEVRSAHFTVITDAGDRDGRHLADQFERMRWLFQTLFPQARVDPPTPIVVVAVRTRKEMQALEPTAYLAKNAVNLAGLFLREPEKNYILLRLDTEEEHPYSTVYHEFTHLVLGTGGMPLWLNEGLAQFFQNTDIRDKDVLFGQISAADLAEVQRQPLIPLPVLLQVDANSPYYHQEAKGSLFYAESWLLTHYLMIKDFKEHTSRVDEYIRLVSQNVDSVSAANQAFGDLHQLQAVLQGYTNMLGYTVLRLSSAAAPIDEKSLTATPMTLPEADAVRGDVMLYTGRSDEARALLQSVLQADPGNVQAHESMGALELQSGHRDEAKKWYAQAVALDSQSYIAQYYNASLALRDGDRGDAVEKGLRAAIRLNPGFAPAWDLLSTLYRERQDRLDEARMLNLQAVQLDPANVNYRLNAAGILVEMGHYDDAIRVLEAAQPIAKSPLELDVVRRVLAQVRQQQAYAEQAKKAQLQGQVQTTMVTHVPGGAVSALEQKEPAFRHPTEAPHGRMLTARGVLRGVTCSYPAVIELRLEGGTKTLSLYSNNYYKVDYSAANFTPSGDVHPCQDLEGMKAEVEYFATADKTTDGQIVAIMMIH
ncbi:MAG TPA: tetratricopeptide repeat protein [Acidobacteriaceae bacterium]|jgi:tetratricopeptide (TPR) repeat protein|nr:tetratricopeptide repeat protein [Acidobacteriaceae bacterium]